jgi:DNA-binding XRE family transcriptional regulator
VSQETISHVEIGRRDGTPELRAKIAKALGVRVAAIWPNEEAA